MSSSSRPSVGRQRRSQRQLTARFDGFFSLKWLLTTCHSVPCCCFLSASYFIASSEVELGTPIDAKEYLSGRIFVGSTSAAAAPSGAAAFAVPKAAAATPFNRIKAANASAKNNESGGGGAAMMQAIMADPTLLVLNRRGIIEQGEKAVVSEIITCAQ